MGADFSFVRGTCLRCSDPLFESLSLETIERQPVRLADPKMSCLERTRNSIDALRAARDWLDRSCQAPLADQKLAHVAV